MTRFIHPFMVILYKEISDHVRSWRFIILIIIIALTCLGSMYTALTNIGNAVKPNDPEGSFFFLKLFTISDGTLPSFFVFISFLGPLLGISLGFDAVNSEQNLGTLSRILSQPIHRDYLLNAKFLAALIVISVMFFALGFLVMGLRTYYNRHTSDSRRVFSHCFLFNSEHTVCGILAEFVYSIFGAIPSAGNICLIRDRSMVVLFRILCNDS